MDFCAKIAAIEEPNIVAAKYIGILLKLLDAIFGPNVRAGFIDAPLYFREISITMQTAMPNAREIIGALCPFSMARQPMKTIENVPINSETNSLRMNWPKQTSYFIYLNSIIIIIVNKSFYLGLS